MTRILKLYVLELKLLGTRLTTVQGGTWYENTYPGVRCDIPAHAYQSGFEPNTQWSEEFAQGAELCNYWQGLAKKYDVYKYLRFQQKVTKAEWLPEEAKWKLTVQDLAAGKVRTARHSD